MSIFQSLRRVRRYRNQQRTLRRPVPSARRLQVETLEDRTLPVITLVGGVLSVIGTPLADVITLTRPDAATIDVDINGGAETGSFALALVTSVVVDADAGKDVINLDVGSFAGDSVIAGGISIDSGLGADTVHIRAAASPTTVTSSGGEDTVVVSDAGSARRVTAPLTVLNPAGLTSLMVDDSVDTVGREVFVTESAIHDLAAAPITYDGTHVSGLTLSGGSGGNSFTLLLTPPVLTMLFSGTGSDTVNVHALGGELHIDGVGGADTVRISDDGSAQAIFGRVRIVNTGGTTNLTVDDSTRAFGLTMTLQTLAADPSFGRIEGLAPFPIDYRYSDLTEVNLFHGGAGGDNVFVRDTVVPVNIYGSRFTTIKVYSTAGSGAVPAGLSPFGDPDGTAQTILGNVYVVYPSFRLIVDDCTNDKSQTVTVDILDRDRTAGVQMMGIGYIEGLAPGIIYFEAGSNIGAVDIRTGMRNDTVNVNRTLFGIVTTLDSCGEREELVTVGDPALGIPELTERGMNGIQGPVHVRNEGGLTRLTLEDTQSTIAKTAFLSRIDMTGMSPATVSWEEPALRSLTINGGMAGNTFNVLNTPFNPDPDFEGTTLNAGPGDDATVAFATTGRLFLAGQTGRDSLTGASGADQFWQLGLEDELADAGILSGEPGASPAGFGCGPSPLLVEILFETTEHLIGSPCPDEYRFIDQGRLNGTIDGVGLQNVLDYTSFQGNIFVNLQMRAATAIYDEAGMEAAPDRLSNIQFVRGSSVQDGGFNVLIGVGGNFIQGGNDRSDFLVAGGTRSELQGLTGNDILLGGSTIYDSLPDWIDWFRFFMQAWSDGMDYPFGIDQLIPFFGPGTVSTGGELSRLLGQMGSDLFIGQFDDRIDPREFTDWSTIPGEEDTECFFRVDIQQCDYFPFG